MFFKKNDSLIDKVLKLEPEMEKLSDGDLSNKTKIFRLRLEKGESADSLLPEAFTVCREAINRVLGMKAFRVQIMGGISLYQGKVIEMKTGEGKTLTAVFPAYFHALKNKKVHIVTVNEYLAKRDSEQMGMVFAFLGLSTGLITSGQSIKEKKAAYNCDIIYGTNNEFGFDYLRDNIAKTIDSVVQTGHHFAIIDEADSVLIDEARTPLIISGKDTLSSPFTEKADAFVRLLKPDCYDLDEKEKRISLNEKGIEKAEQFFNIKNLANPKHSALRHYVSVALQAYHIAKRDVDYIVGGGKIILVDQFTGRLVPGKVYREGLHQAIEIKEKVNMHPENRVIATISQQNYFRMYEKLAGMTGTALSEREEFRHIYGLDVVEIPTNMPMIRKDYPDKVYKTQREKWEAVALDIIARHQKKQPILIGTTSIEKSEMLSKILSTQGVPHTVLNAKNNELEAEIISSAGQLGAVTVATNMAGRGTDIVLGGNSYQRARQSFVRKYGKEPENASEFSFIGEMAFDEEALIKKEKGLVLKLGGLCVIGTERHSSRRIDDQLRGRAGRQGDIGESQFYLSLEDDLLAQFGGEKVKALAGAISGPLSTNLLSNIIERAQRALEGIHFNTRKTLLQYDDIINIQRTLVYKDRKTVLESDREALLKYIGNINENILVNAKSLADDTLRAIILEVVDSCWTTHLEEISYLRQGVSMHANPLESFRREVFAMYQEMVNQINEEIISKLK